MCHVVLMQVRAQVSMFAEQTLFALDCQLALLI